MPPIAFAALVLLTAPQEADAPRFERLVAWPANSGPVGREHAVFVSDSVRERGVLFGGSGYVPYGTPLGDAWTFDFGTETWRALEVVGDVPAAAGSRRAAAVEGGAFLFGGYLADSVPDGSLLELSFGEEELIVGTVPQTNPPAARLLHGFACDAEGERFVVFGGASSTGMFSDTWIGHREAEGVMWKEWDFDDGPGQRFGFPFGYDPQTKRFLVCGGQVPPDSGGAQLAFARDLWALDFEGESPSWTLLAEFDAETYPGRRNPCFAFDEESGDLFVWGGTGDGATALAGIYVVRTREEGAPVERFAEFGNLTTRASGFGVVDATGKRVFIGFGNTGAGPFRDMAAVRLRGPLDAELVKLREQAMVVRELVETDAARALLAAVPQLPAPRPTSVFTRSGRGYMSDVYTMTEYDGLTEEERVGVQETSIDGARFYETYFGTPVAAVHAYDIAAGFGIDSFEGLRICEFGIGSIGQLRLLAASGASVVGVDVMPFLRAVYAAPGSEGPFGARGGEVNLAFGQWPADAPVVDEVGFSLDLFLSKNTMKRGFVAPSEDVPEHRRIDLGVPNEVFLGSLFEVLRPGGLAVFYNLGGQPAAEGEAYKPSTDIASPWSPEEYAATGFEVLAFDVEDSDAARVWGRVLGWADSMDLDTQLFGIYTVLRRPTMGASTK